MQIGTLIRTWLTKLPGNWLQKRNAHPEMCYLSRTLLWYRNATLTDYGLEVGLALLWPA